MCLFAMWLDGGCFCETRKNVHFLLSVYFCIKQMRKKTEIKDSSWSNKQIDWKHYYGMGILQLYSINENNPKFKISDKRCDWIFRKIPILIILLHFEIQFRNGNMTFMNKWKKNHSSLNMLNFIFFMS